MPITTELKKTAADTGYAVVGATDLVVERVRQAQARAAALRPELEVKKVSGRVQQAPTVAVTKGLEAAGRVEETYGELSARGKKLVERIRKQRATQDLLAQGKVAVSRTRAAVTTIRRSASDVETAAKATATTAKREATAGAEEVSATTRKRAAGTKTAAKRTTSTAKKRAAATKTAAKAAATSVEKTAEKAQQATTAAAEKVGD
ncbi:MAG: hypothetical protein ACLGIV_00790 [Actinomycetes bacterium]